MINYKIFRICTIKQNISWYVRSLKGNFQNDLFLAPFGSIEAFVKVLFLQIFLFYTETLEILSLVSSYQ